MHFADRGAVSISKCMNHPNTNQSIKAKYADFYRISSTKSSQKFADVTHNMILYKSFLHCKTTHLSNNMPN